MIDRLHHFLPSWALALASRARASAPGLFIGLLAPFRLLPLSSKKWGPPKAMVNRADLTEQPWFDYHQAQVESWRIPLPQNFVPRLGTVFGESSKPDTWDSGYACLQSSRVLGPHGAVITPDDHVVSDYSRIIGRPGKAHPALGSLSLPKVELFHGRLAVLQVHQAANYYHWVLELLPRLGLLKTYQVEIDAYYVSNRTKFQHESLALAGLKSNQIRDPLHHPHIEAECLIAPSRPEVGRPSPLAIKLLQNLFWPSITPGKRCRIYITRRLATRRRVVNEAALEPVLARYGIEIVETENLDFKAQVGLFFDAEWVIAPHGAGLANLVFCQPSTRVLEFFAADYVNNCYWAVAGAAGLDYHCLVDTQGESNAPFKQGPHGRSDILVDTTALTELLGRWS